MTTGYNSYMPELRLTTKFMLCLVILDSIIFQSKMDLEYAFFCAFFYQLNYLENAQKFVCSKSIFDWNVIERNIIKDNIMIIVLAYVNYIPLSLGKWTLKDKG